MSGITTHVLDTSGGRPASGVGVRLEHQREGSWELVGQGRTDADGRCRTLLTADAPVGHYRLTFDTGGWFEGRNVKAFFPQVVIVFGVEDPSQHYHVPLLLSPFGYSTYRGS